MKLSKSDIVLGNLLGFSNPSGLGITTNNLDPMIGLLSNSVNNPLYPNGGIIGPMNPLFQVLSLLNKNKLTTENEIPDTDPTIKATVNEAALTALMNSKVPNIVNSSYADNDESIALTEGHLRGAKLSKKLLRDVKAVSDKYKVDPFEILAIAGKESTFGYGKFGGGRRENGEIDAQSLFTYNDAYKTPAKSYLQYLYENKGDKRVGVDKNFHGIDFYVKPLGKKAEDDNFIEMYNDEKLIGDYKKYLDTVPKGKDLNILEEVAKRIKTKGIASYNPGQKNYTDLVNQYKEMLLKNKTPIEFPKGGSVGYVFELKPDGGVIGQEETIWDKFKKLIGIVDNKENIYKSGDALTDTYINMMSGVGHSDFWDRKKLLDMGLKNEGYSSLRDYAEKKYDNDFSKVIDSRLENGESIDKIIYSMTNGRYTVSDKKNINKSKFIAAVSGSKDIEDTAFYNLLGFREDSKKDSSTYNGLWDLQLKNGNPKINILPKGSRSYFLMGSNTMNLADPSEYIDELAHSKQLNDNGRFPMILRSLKEVLMNPTTLFSKKAYDDILYKKEGTIENEAHSKIAPMLRNELNLKLQKGGDVDIEQAKGGGFFGKILKGLGAGADGILSNIGLGNVIKNSGFDQAVERNPLMGKIAGLSSGILGAGLNFALPGVGAAFSMGKGLLNNIGGSSNGVTTNSSNTSGFDFGYKESDSSPNYNYGSLLSGLTPVFNNPMFNGIKGIGAGVNPFGGLLSQMGSGTNQNNLIQLLQGLSGGKTPTFTGQPMYMEEGGEVQMSPIQTEKGEYLIHLDNSITKTNATKKHSKMDKDEVTDVVPENTFVASADKKSSIKKKDVENIVLGVKTMPYEEAKQGKIPEKILFSDIFKSNKMTPAELTEQVMKKYEVIDKSDEFNKNDVFTKLTNKENMDERAIWLNVIKVLNEDKKNGTNSFKKGGEIDMYPKGGTVPKNGNIPHYDLGDWVGILGSAAPLLANIFGKGNSDKTAQNIALGSIPLHTLGLTNNINAQKAAYGTAISDFTGLGQNLNNFALGQAGANIAGRLSQDTSYGRFDPTTQDARLANFNTRTPNSFIDALTPKVDYGTLASTLGARGFNSAVGNIAGNQIEGRNTAAINAFNQDRSLGLNILGQRNNLDSFSQQFNLGQREKQQAAENSQKAGIFGDISSLQGRLGDIQSQILPITTQFQLQRAGLEGQIPMGIAQNAQSIAALIAMNNAQNGTGGSNSGGNADLTKLLNQLLTPANKQLQGVKNNVSTQNLNQNRLDLSSIAKLLQRPLSNVNITPQSRQDPDCYNGVSITTGMPC